jgi:hypothetical protein
MLAKDADDAHLWQFGQLAHDLAGHQMETARLGF